MIRRLTWIGLWLMTASAAIGQSNIVKGDTWLAGSPLYPASFVAGQADVRSNAFPDLKAEFIAGRVKVRWSGDGIGRDASVSLVSSEEAPGHWPARDWRAEEMSHLQTGFEKVLRIEDLDIPQVYFVKVVQGAEVWESPMRIFKPREAGMDMPTRLFWSFLEGFEEGTASWKLMSRESEGGALRTSPTARSGTASLLVALGPRQRPITIGTTRLRGWQIRKQGATGVRLWLRTVSGQGRVRFALHTSAFTPDQAVSVTREETALNDQWQRIDLSFEQFPSLALGNVDFFSLEFSGEGAREFLLDNLELLGKWKPED